MPALRYDPDPADSVRCPHCHATTRRPGLGTDGLVETLALHLRCPVCHERWYEARDHESATAHWVVRAGVVA
jgi:hypothetical protein